MAFTHFEVGFEYTPGAKPGTTPAPGRVRIVAGKTVDAHEALDILRGVFSTLQQLVAVANLTQPALGYKIFAAENPFLVAIYEGEP